MDHAQAPAAPRLPELAEPWTNSKASSKATVASFASKASGRHRLIDPTTCERDYSAEELEFMDAMQAYKQASAGCSRRGARSWRSSAASATSGPRPDSGQHEGFRRGELTAGPACPRVGTGRTSPRRRRTGPRPLRRIPMRGDIILNRDEAAPVPASRTSLPCYGVRVCDVVAGPSLCRSGSGPRRSGRRYPRLTAPAFTSTARVWAGSAPCPSPASTEPINRPLCRRQREAPSRSRADRPRRAATARGSRRRSRAPVPRVGVGNGGTRPLARRTRRGSASSRRRGRRSRGWP